MDDFQSGLIQISNSTIAALDGLWAVSDSSGDSVSLLDTLEDPDAPNPVAEVDAAELKDRVADAIAMAGGLSPFAKRGEQTLIRFDDKGGER